MDCGPEIRFPTSSYDAVEQALAGFRSHGALLDLLPSWVRRIVGFGREGGHPPLGLDLPQAKTQVDGYIQRLPEEVSRRTPILPYQVDGIAFGVHRGGRVLIGDDMGLGKTLQALILAAQYASEWPVLIVAPSSLRYVWRDQAIQWLPHVVGLEGDLIHVLQNGKDRAPINKRMIIGTYDLVRRCEHLQRRPDGRQFLVVVIDESQSIKDAGSMRTKAVVGICKAARRAILLSGTPALNRAAELYTQIDAISPSDMPSFVEFAERYSTRQVQRFGKRTVEKFNGVQRPEELNILLSSSVMIRRLKKDVLSQLPSKRRMRISLDPEKMNQEVLREVERRMKAMKGSIEELEGSSSNCDVNISQLFRLTADAKIAASLEYVEHLIRLGIKFLLFAHHHSTLDALERKIVELKTDLIRIDGKTSASQRPERVARFQQEDIVRVALLSITAAGTGLTLTAAQTVVFAELYWVPGQMQQAEDRAHRIGQRDCVAVHYLVAKNTIDDVVYNSLEKKSKNTSAILDGRECGFDAVSTENRSPAEVQAAPQSKRECDLQGDPKTSPSKRARLE